MKIVSDVYCRSKLVSHRKDSVKWPYKPAFYAFMCLCITENQSLWAFQSDRSIPPVLLLKVENNIDFIDLILSFQCHIVLSIISVFYHNLMSIQSSPVHCSSKKGIMIKFTVCGNENLYHCQIHRIE